MRLIALCKINMKKLKYLIRIFDDETAELLEGRDLGNFQKEVNSALALAAIHFLERKIRVRWKILDLKKETLENLLKKKRK